MIMSPFRSRSTSCPNFLAEIFAKVSCRDLGHGVDRKFSQANKQDKTKVQYLCEETNIYMNNKNHQLTSWLQVRGVVDISDTN